MRHARLREAQTRRSMQSRIGHVKVIPPGPLKCVALHCLQGDLLTQKDITHREIALRRKAPVRNYIARSIQFVNVHRLAAPDAIAGSGVRSQERRSRRPLSSTSARSIGTGEEWQIRQMMSTKKINAMGTYAAACAILRQIHRGGQIVGTGSVCDGQDSISKSPMQRCNRGIVR